MYVDGSYNGVFPNEGMFFKDQSLQEQGFDIINNMFEFYASLDKDGRASVTGMTLMNEPCHSMPEDKDAMISWMGIAVAMFRSNIVDQYPNDHPKLYMNLISTCISDEDSLSFMLNTFSTEELNTWAVLGWCYVWLYVVKW